MARPGSPVKVGLAWIDGLVATLRDEDGRPVAEVGSIHWDPAAADLGPCPFADRRRGGTMNRAALRQLAACFPEVTDRLAALSPPRSTVAEAFGTAARATSSALAFAVAHPDAPVPRLHSALYKTSLGFSQVLAALALRDPALAATPLAELGDGAAFAAFLDAGGWLLGESQVCAGPPGHLAAAFAALCQGRGEPDPDRDDVLVCVARMAAAIVAAPLATGPGTPTLRHLLGPHGPSWGRALLGEPGRRPADAARLFPAGSPAALAALAFAEAADGRPAEVVERRLRAAIAGDADWTTR